MRTSLRLSSAIKFDSRGGHNCYNCNLDFFKKWSNEMAYVLGFLYADGNIIDASVSSRTQYIKFSNNKKEIIEKIRLVLKAKHPSILVRLAWYYIEEVVKFIRVRNVFI